MYSPFTNSLYDQCNLVKKDQEATGAYNWVTDNTIQESKDACFATTNIMHNPFHSIPSTIVDAESDLRNQTRLLSRCPETRFDPTKAKNCLDCSKCDSGLPCDCQHCKETKYNAELKDCNEGLVPLFTRINKPCNLSGITINRFEPLCEDPQELTKIHSNKYIGGNTRLQVKDQFKVKNPRQKSTGSSWIPLNEAFNKTNFSL